MRPPASAATTEPVWKASSVTPRARLCQLRLQITDDEQLTFRLKTPWSDGTTHLLLSPLELMEKLAALVPPRRLNLIRYHGVLAPNASARNQIVPAPLVEATSIEPTAEVSAQARAHRGTWAALLARVFDIDGTLCPNCGGSMRLIAALTDESSIRHYLTGVGLPAVPPPIAPARSHLKQRSSHRLSRHPKVDAGSSR